VEAFVEAVGDMIKLQKDKEGKGINDNIGSKCKISKCRKNETQKNNV